MQRASNVVREASHFVRVLGFLQLLVVEEAGLEGLEPLLEGGLVGRVDGVELGRVVVEVLDDRLDVLEGKLSKEGLVVDGSGVVGAGLVLPVAVEGLLVECLEELLGLFPGELELLR